MLRTTVTSVSRLLGMSVIASLCLVVSGCGGGGAPGRAQASGTITLDGQPLEKGTVFFVDDKGTVAGVGNVQAGSFAKGESAIPAKYKDAKTSGLKAEVEAGSNSFEFAVTSK